MSQDQQTVHASCVSHQGTGLLILGNSGSGKSLLALRLLAFGMSLVADDRTILRRKGDTLHATCPEPILGLIEARGLGVLRCPYFPETRINLVIRLSAPTGSHSPERLPAHQKITLLGVTCPLIETPGTHPGLPEALSLWLKGADFLLMEGE